jgi:hypothetical protein
MTLRFGVAPIVHFKLVGMIVAGKWQSINRIAAGFIIPAQPVLASRPPSGCGWVHEIKYDGFSRNAYDWTRTTGGYRGHHPPLAQAEYVCVCVGPRSGAVAERPALERQASGDTGLEFSLPPRF